MDRVTALKIMKEENLTDIEWYNKKGEHNRDVVGIDKENGKWVVYACKTDPERGCGIVTGSEFYYDTEEEALDRLIFRLRAGKDLREIQERRKLRS